MTDLLGRSDVQVAARFAGDVNLFTAPMTTVVLAEDLLEGSPEAVLVGVRVVVEDDEVAFAGEVIAIRGTVFTVKLTDCVSG